MTINAQRSEASSSLALENASKQSLSPRTSSSTSSPVAINAQKWNTRDLPWRFLSDITSAACASGLVAPIITIIDRSIIENASARAPLLTSVRTSLTALVLTPHRFLTSRPTRLIAAVYFGTYLTANSTDTLCSTVTPAPAASTTAGPAKFFATSTVNMSMGLYKDSQFARMFGPLPSPLKVAAASAPPSPAATIARRSIPAASYALFALRDSLTIFASFNLPPLLTPWLPAFSRELEANISRQSVAQILAPAAIQILSTPMHLWGLDLYNRPKGGGRLAKVARDWFGSSLARMCRVVPAFGVGGVVNGRVRKDLMGRVEGR